MGMAQKVVGVGIAGGVTTAAVQAMATVQAPYDSVRFSNPAIATQATVTFPATAGKAWLIAYATFTMESAGVIAVNQRRFMTIQDGVTVIWSAAMVLPAQTAAGGGQNIANFPNLAIVGTVGNAVTVTFINPPVAGSFQTVNACAYLI